MGDLSAASQWRARALSRFVITGWKEGVAAIIISGSFSELARVNDDYPAGQFLDVIKPAPAALAILDEAASCAAETPSGITVGPNSPSPELIARWVNEKRGFHLLLQGDYRASRKAYERALEMAGFSRRGRVKVQLGLELLNYLEALASGGLASSTATEALTDEAKAFRDANLTDLVKLGSFNALEMTRGSRHLKPYEIL